MIRRCTALALLIAAELTFSVFASFPPTLEREMLIMTLFGMVCGAYMTYLMKNCRAIGAIFALGTLVFVAWKLRIVNNSLYLQPNSLFLLITATQLFAGFALLILERRPIEKTPD